MYKVKLVKEEMEKNFLEDRIKKINEQFYHIRDKENIVVWGAGRHTRYLFAYTDIRKYDFIIVDRRASGNTGFDVINPEEVNWEEVTAVVVSSLRFSREIICTLKEKYKYGGEVIQLYEPDEIWEFWQLNRNKDSCFWGDFLSFYEAERVAGVWNEAETFGQELEVLRNILQEPKAWYWTYWLQKNMLQIYMRDCREHLCVIDFGGGFGQEYFNDRDVLCDFKQVNWIVVDQKKHVEYGRKYLQTDELKFADNLDEAMSLAGRICSLIILGGVLPYIDKWKEFLAEVINLNIPYLLINRENVAERERICIQNMGAYNSSSVFRIFNRQELLDVIREKYVLVDSIEYMENGVIFSDLPVKEECWLFRRRSANEDTR